MTKAKFALSLLFVIAVSALVGSAASYTVLTSASIQHSMIDSTTIGATTPSTVVFTAAKGSAFVGNKNVVTDGSGNMVEAGTSTTGSLQVWLDSGCTIADSTDGSWCSGTMSIPTPWADAAYQVVCQGIINNDAIGYAKIKLRSAGSFTYDYTATRGNGVGGYTPNLMCFSYHP